MRHAAVKAIKNSSSKDPEPQSGCSALGKSSRAFTSWGESDCCVSVILLLGGITIDFSSVFTFLFVVEMQKAG